MSEHAPAFELTDRGYTVRALYGAAPGDDARIVITRGDEVVRDLAYPAYRIWNIAAHFGEIVDDLINAPATAVEAAPEPAPEPAPHSLDDATTREERTQREETR